MEKETTPRHYTKTFGMVDFSNVVQILKENDGVIVELNFKMSRSLSNRGCVEGFGNKSDNWRLLFASQWPLYIIAQK